VARLLIDLGYQNVAVLQGGYSAWEASGGDTETIRPALRDSVAWIDSVTEHADPGGSDPFLSSLEDRSFLHGRELPFQRDLTVLFVDMVDSTPLVMELDPPEGVYHCGDVHDFEGDGALLYFEGPGEALPAAFEMRRRLIALRDELPMMPLPRLSLDRGRVVVGTVGSRFRRGVGLIGPCVPRASRILKLAPAGGIVVTDPVLEAAKQSNPDLYATFRMPVQADDLRGIDGSVLIHVSPWVPEAAPVSGESVRSESLRA
jgi:class 3 adenylate cyclase